MFYRTSPVAAPESFSFPACNFIINEITGKMFFCEFWKIFKDISSLAEHLRMTASCVYLCLYDCFLCLSKIITMAVSRARVIFTASDGNVRWSWVGDLLVILLRQIWSHKQRTLMVSACASKPSQNHDRAVGSRMSCAWPMDSGILLLWRLLAPLLYHPRTEQRHSCFQRTMPLVSNNVWWKMWS